MLIDIAAVILVGAPIMLAEILMGRRAEKDPVGTFNLLAAGKRGARLWPGVGVLGLITGFVILSYYTAYTAVAGWTLRYILMAIGGQLGELATHPSALEAFFGGFLAAGGQQILYYLLFMAATVSVVYFGIAKGIERANLVMMPSLFLILLAMLVYSAFFYLPVAFAALTSTINLLEVISSFAIDELGWRRPRTVLTLGSATALFGMLSALSFGSNGRLSSVNLIRRNRQPASSARSTTWPATGCCPGAAS